MKDSDGDVLIDGFYASTAAVTETESAAMSELPDFDARLRSELGLGSHRGPTTLPWRSDFCSPPSIFAVCRAAAVGDRARNIIPMEATVSIDIRLAKGNDPVEMLDLVEAHIAEQGFTIVREEPDTETRLSHYPLVRVERREGYPAARTSMDLPIVERVFEAAESWPPVNR